MPTRSLTLDLPGGACDALLATPERPGPHPPVLFCMDAFGVRPRTAEMAAQMADLGYTVLLPNLYYRTGPAPLVDPELQQPGREAELRDLMMRLLGSYPAEHWAADGPALLRALAGLDESTDEPASLVGYCMGARLALVLAADEPDRVAKVAGYHAAGLVEGSERSPHLRLPEVSASLYYLHADDDPLMSAEAQRVFADAARAAGVDYTGELAEGALHAFTMTDRPAYDAAAEARHWQTLAAHLAR